jgi:hypothetical protein
MPSTTLNFTANQAQRISVAVGANFNPPRNATEAEVKAVLVAHLKGLVHSYETQQAAIAAADAVVPMPDPT